MVGRYISALRLSVYQRTHAVLPNHFPRYTYARHFERLLHIKVKQKLDAG